MHQSESKELAPLHRHRRCVGHLRKSTTLPVRVEEGDRILPLFHAEGNSTNDEPEQRRHDRPGKQHQQEMPHVLTNKKIESFNMCKRAVVLFAIALVVLVSAEEDVMERLRKMREERMEALKDLPKFDRAALEERLKNLPNAPQFDEAEFRRRMDSVEDLRGSHGHKPFDPEEFRKNLEKHQAEVSETIARLRREHGLPADDGDHRARMEEAMRRFHDTSRDMPDFETRMKELEKMREDAMKMREKYRKMNPEL